MTHRVTAGVPEPAQTLEWLRTVGAVRSVAVDEAGEFIVETPDRKLLALPAAAVPAFRAGVLAGWRLPRTGGRA